jgi:hypothetical protein
MNIIFRNEQINDCFIFLTLINDEVWLDAYDFIGEPVLKYKIFSNVWITKLNWNKHKFYSFLIGV